MIAITEFNAKGSKDTGLRYDNFHVAQLAVQDLHRTAIDGRLYVLEIV